MAPDRTRSSAIPGEVAAPLLVLDADGRPTLNDAARALLGLPERVEPGALPAAEAARRALAGERPPAEVVDWGGGPAARPLLVLWSPLPGGGARARAGRDLTPLERYGDEAPWVRADPVRLEQIIDTPVGNAVKHTPEGGRVEVTAAREGEEVRCVVSDTGVGLAAEALARLFDLPPARLRRADGGLGVALGIAHYLAAAQGGRLQAESDGPGRGARFTLCLPFAETA